MKKLLACLVSVAILGPPTHALADGVYHWIDENGRPVYSDLPPPPSVKRLEQKSMRANQVETDKLPYAVRKAAESFPVTLYTTPDAKCTGCPMAKQYLARRGVPFSEIVVESDEQIADALKVLGGEQVEVPALVVGGRAYKGYSTGEWDAALNSAGYPPAKR